jgi:ABC-2 type transport system ATP-binding protein
LAQFRIEEAGDRMARTYSGGMRRRLDLAGALVADPPVLFLDEPTTGLDPRGRTDMWELIQTLVAGGTSCLLTTQYLEEADLLADNIMVIDHGKVIAEGTSDELKAQVGGERLEITLTDGSRLERARELLEPLGVGRATLDQHRRLLVMPVSGGATVLTDALRTLDAAQIVLQDVALRRPTLDDVFLILTGHAAEQADDQTKKLTKEVSR